MHQLGSQLPESSGLLPLGAGLLGGAAGANLARTCDVIHFRAIEARARPWSAILWFVIGASLLACSTETIWRRADLRGLGRRVPPAARCPDVPLGGGPPQLAAAAAISGEGLCLAFTQPMVAPATGVDVGEFRLSAVRLLPAGTKVFSAMPGGSDRSRSRRSATRGAFAAKTIMPRLRLFRVG